MSYRIEYDGNTRKYEIRRGSRAGRYTAVFFLLFLLLVSTCWPSGKETLQRILFPGGSEIAVNALNTLADNLSTGEGFAHSMEAFCQEIIAGGSIPR